MMKNNIMQTINDMYKKTTSLEETEISKLESLLTQVGGDARSILLKADEITMAGFLNTCIRNGITFQLHENRLQKGTSEKEESSHSSPLTDDNSLCTQSPSEGEKSCEEGCVEVEECGERITLENWKELLSSGDRVTSVHKEGNKKQHIIEYLEASSYQGFGFMFIEGDWVYFTDDNTCEEGFSYYAKK